MKRSGFTLVELLVVMVVEVALIGIATMLIMKSADFRMRSGEAFDAALSVRRLSEALRADIHAAREAAVVEDGKGLALESTRNGKNEMILYTLRKRPESFTPELVRTTHEGDASGKILAVECFALAEGTHARFATGTPDSPETLLVALSLWGDPDGRTPPPEELDPFTRTPGIPGEADPGAVDPRMSANWTVILARKGGRDVQ